MNAECLTSEGIAAVILACKSDPDAPLEVEAASVNSMAEQYNIGLIEVTVANSEGKMKMRNALRWLLYKLEQRQRELKLSSRFDLPI